MADDVDALKAQNKDLRRLVCVLTDAIKDVSVTGVDQRWHVSYDCDGQWGHRCGCGMHDLLVAAEELLGDE